MNPKNNTVITTGKAGGYDCVHFFSRLKNGRKNGIIYSERIISTEDFLLLHGIVLVKKQKMI